MPVIEVIHAAEEPATRDQKDQFMREATQVFREVLDTPDGRLRIFFYSLDDTDSNAGLLAENATRQRDDS